MELIMTAAEIVTAIGIWVMVVLLVKQLRRPLPTPQVTVEAPKIEVPAPVVHVDAPAAPEVKVSIPPIEVPTPVVNYRPPDVTVSIPPIEVPAPVVHVGIPPTPEHVRATPHVHRHSGLCRVLEKRDEGWAEGKWVRVGKPDHQHALDTPGLAIQNPDGSVDYGVQE